MSESEETPQQRQLRLRQAKREAKLKASGQERLDKITKLSGRTPESMRDTPSPSPAAREPMASATPTPATRPTQIAPRMLETDDPEQRRMQEQYLRALLGTPDGSGQDVPSQDTPAGQPAQSEQQEAMMKMMESFLGGMSGDPNAPGAQELPISADDISKMTGLPPYLTKMFMPGKQKAPPTAAEITAARTWAILQTLFAIMVGVYSVFTIHKSVSLYGTNPPAPATIQNPFVLFATGEVLLRGTMHTLGGQSGAFGPKALWKLLKEVGRDGAILVFVLGLYSAWQGLA